MSNIKKLKELIGGNSPEFEHTGYNGKISGVGPGSDSTQFFL